MFVGSQRVTQLVAWCSNRRQSTGGAGTALFSCCSLTVNASLCGEKTNCAQRGEISTTPYHLLFISAPVYETQLLLLFCLSLYEGRANSHNTLLITIFPAKRDLASTLNTFFPSKFHFHGVKRQKITAYFQHARRVISSQPGKGPPLNWCQNEICSKASNFH